FRSAAEVGRGAHDAITHDAWEADGDAVERLHRFREVGDGRDQFVGVDVLGGRDACLAGDDAAIIVQYGGFDVRAADVDREGPHAAEDTSSGVSSGHSREFSVFPGMHRAVSRTTTVE